MIKINRELIDALPTKFIDALVHNLVTQAKTALKERDKYANQYVFSNDELAKVQALHADARAEAYRDVLTMLGKQQELQDLGNINE